ncbi:MAG: tRNA dihydrouridine synthase DusB [Gammaproteobacteria bacterium]|nr:MAG: tRNA dihydrouridine synthase DusB [Gammaproteobacteria bacterium]
MKIGPYQFDNNLILAPMAGITDRPFRQLCKEFGAAMAMSEMVSAKPELRHTRKSQLRLDRQGESGLHWVQIAGSEAEVLADAARYNVNQGADIIDINMGCPVKKVYRKAAGSALLADEGLVQEICQQVVAAVNVPVTLKIRTGTDSNNKNAVNIAKIAQSSGIRALTIHGRTREEKFTGKAEYKTIRQVRDQLDITLIANGDIDSPEKALEVLNLTQADGLMIGRAAQGTPWIFREINYFLATGRKHGAISDLEIAEIMARHIGALHQFYGDVQGVKFARKHVAWYLRSYPDGKTFSHNFNKITGPKQQLLAIESWLATDKYQKI